MGRKGVGIIILILLASVTVSGCKTAQLKREEELKGMKAKIEALESKVDTVESRQAEAERMAIDKMAALESRKGESNAAINFEVKPRDGKHAEKIKDIQTALKNAGYYSGNVDGVKGKQTRKAIKEFQKANGLSADGVVGTKTWDALSKYLQQGQSESEGTIK